MKIVAILLIAAALTIGGLAMDDVIAEADHIPVEVSSPQMRKLEWSAAVVLLIGGSLYSRVKRRNSN